MYLKIDIWLGLGVFETKQKKAKDSSDRLSITEIWNNDQHDCYSLASNKNEIYLFSSVLLSFDLVKCICKNSSLQLFCLDMDSQNHEYVTATV